MKGKIVIFGILIMMLLFSTVAMAVYVAPVQSNEFPADTETCWDVPSATFNLTLTDIDSGFNWSIDTYPDVGNSSSVNATNGSKTCSLSGMLYSTTYRIYVNSSSNNTHGASAWTNASYNFTTRDAKLRENAEFTGIEQAIVGVVGIIILFGFLYVILKTDFKKEGALAKILVGLIVALALLTVMFSAL